MLPHTARVVHSRHNSVCKLQMSSMPLAVACVSRELWCKSRVGFSPSWWDPCSLFQRLHSHLGCRIWRLFKQWRFYDERNLFLRLSISPTLSTAYYSEKGIKVLDTSSVFIFKARHALDSVIRRKTQKSCFYRTKLRRSLPLLYKRTSMSSILKCSFRNITPWAKSRTK